MIEKLDELLDLLEEFSSGTLGGIGSALDDAVDNIIERVKGVVEGITSPITRTLELAQGISTNILTKVIQGFDTVKSSSSALVNTLQGEISSAIEGALAGLESGLSVVFEKVLEPLQDAVGVGLAAVSDTANDIFGSIGDTISELSSGVSTLPGKIVGGIDSLIDGIVASVKLILDKAGSALAEVVDRSAAILGVVGDKIGEAGDSIGDALQNLLSGFFGFRIGDQMPQVMTQMEFMAEMIEDHPKAPPELKAALGGGLAPLGVMGLVLLPFFLGAMVGGPANAFMAGLTTSMTHDSLARDVPSELMITDALELLRRSPANEPLVTSTLKRQGFDPVKRQALEELSIRVLPVAEVLQLWHRDEITPEELTRRLKENGIGANESDHIKSLSFPVPAIADIIRMAVREVFTPEIARAFGQFEEMPPEYVANARKAGLSEEWATNFWGAHWELPSIQLGYEMLHRGVIDQDELERLLVALDVMPGWRDKLTQISYTPFTRVDIRRMHKLGVMDLAKVERAYLDIGYSPEDAKLQRLFVERLNAEPDPDSEMATKELSRTSILQFFRRGLADRRTAVEDLELIGYEPSAAEAFVALEELKVLEAQRDGEIALVRAQFAARTITIEQAGTALDAIQVPERERDQVIRELLTEKQRLLEIPSIAKLESMVELDLIPLETYELELIDRGYSPEWAQKMRQLIEPEDAAKPKERVLTRGDILRLVRLKQISGDEGVARLVDLEYAEPDAILLVRSELGTRSV